MWWVVLFFSKFHQKCFCQKLVEVDDMPTPEKYHKKE